MSWTRGYWLVMSAGYLLVFALLSITFRFSSLYTGCSSNPLGHWEQFLLRKVDRLKRSGLFESRGLVWSFAVLCSAALCPACVGVRYTDIICEPQDICCGYNVFRCGPKGFGRA